MALSPDEKNLCELLLHFPTEFKFRWTEEASIRLTQELFMSLCGGNPQYGALLFPDGIPSNGIKWSLKEAQGAEEGAEYTEAARGQPCGHIFKPGEATYRCRVCTSDTTCVLCARCWEASDHEGHE